MNLRGQSSVEFLTITVFLLGALLLFQIFASAPLEEQITLNKASIAAKKLAQKIDEAYSLGPGTKFFVEIDLPDNIESEFIGSNEFGWTLSTGSGTSDVYELTDAQIIGAIPSVGGIHLIPVEVLFSGIVLVGEGADDFDFPIIFLQAPDDNSTDFDGTVIFDFNVNDFNSSISSCSLIIDGSIDQTDNSITEETAQSFSKIFGSSGTHVWDVNCTDSSVNANEASSVNGPRTINISLAVDTDFPVIYLEAPDNNATDNDGTVQFDFNVSDFTSGIASCELIIDGVSDQSDLTITEGVTQSFTKSGITEGISSWNSVGSGLDDGVFAFAVHDGNLFVGGEFDDSDNIVRWNGSFFFSLGPGLNNDVLALASFDGNIYAGGAFTDAGGIGAADRIAYWDGVSWNSLAGEGISGDVMALAVFDGFLYIGGNFSDAAGISAADNIVRWDGVSWSSVGGGLSDDVSALHVFNGKLFVGGDFSNAGGIGAADRIASWNGVSWSALGAGLNNDVLAINDFQGK